MSTEIYYFSGTVRYPHPYAKAEEIALQKTSTRPMRQVLAPGIDEEEDR